MKVEGRDEALSFVMDEMRTDGVWRDVQVRLFGLPEVLDLIHVGDIDHFNGAAVDQGVLKGAVVRSLETPQESDASLNVMITQGLVGSGPFGGNLTSSGRVPLKTRMAVLSVPLQKAEHGWNYRDEIIKTGSAMTLETALGFALTAVTVQVTPLLANAFGWPAILAGLAIGPVVGITAMMRFLKG